MKDRYSVQVGRGFYNSKGSYRKVFDVRTMMGTNDNRTLVTCRYTSNGIEFMKTCYIESFVKWINS